MKIYQQTSTFIQCRVKSFLLIGVLFTLVPAAGCTNKIETGDSLNKTDKDYINSLIPLDKDEKIYKFYSEYKLKNAGNFYTNKRIAEYWIDPDNRSKDKIQSAFYKDIESIDTVYDVDFSYCPYMAVTKIKGDTAETFDVCFEGKKDELKIVFGKAVELWKKEKQLHK